MSDEKTYTEREVVKRERDAFYDGAAWRANRAMELSDRAFTFINTREYRDAAEKRYPLPKVRRPRVEKFPAVGGGICRVKLIDGQAWYTFGYLADAKWFSVQDEITKGNSTMAENIEQLVDAIRSLRANPTETVEDES